MDNGAEKIVKALRCCSNGSCSECFFRKDKQNCQETMEFMAADMLEYLLSKNDQLHYALLGVMHSVDKWIDDKPRYYDIEDPDGKIAVNRAAEAREIALQAIEKAERERDAAVNELADLEKLIAPSAEMCSICKYANCEAKVEPCASCEPSHERSKWEWRGVVKENSGGADDSTAHD